MINFKNLENKFLEKLNNGLLNKTFEKEDKFPAEIPKQVGEAFIMELLEHYPGVMEFDVKPIMQERIILVKVEGDNDTTMADIIMSIQVEDNSFTIKNILVSLKNLSN